MLPSFFFWIGPNLFFFKRIWLAPSYVCAAPVLLNGFLTKVADRRVSGFLLYPFCMHATALPGYHNVNVCLPNGAASGLSIQTGNSGTVPARTNLSAGLFIVV